MGKPSPKTIGAFVVGGLALVVVAMLTFGSFKFFAPRIPFVMYFDGDISGLDVGAPVMFRGVPVGTVTNITMRFNTDTRQISIPVYSQIEPERFVIEGSDKGGKNIPLMIEDGLRAQLATQSMLTGKAVVQIDFHKDTPLRRFHRDTAMLEIPTVPSAMSALQANVETVLKKIGEMPLPELVDDVRATTKDIDDAVRQLDLKNVAVMGVEGALLLHEVRTLVANVEQRIDTLAPTGEATLKDADQAILEMRRVLADVRPVLAGVQRAAEIANRLLTTANGVIEPGSATQRELIAMLKEISYAARSIRGLADGLERNPDSVFFGKASVGKTK